MFVVDPTYVLIAAALLTGVASAASLLRRLILRRGMRRRAGPGSRLVTRPPRGWVMASLPQLEPAAATPRARDAVVAPDGSVTMQVDYTVGATHGRRHRTREVRVGPFVNKLP